MHIPRTGGIALSKMLEPVVDVKLKQHASVSEIQNAGYLCPDYFWFCFVRNPFDRCVSYYELNRRDNPDYKMTFKEYLSSGVWLQPQINYLWQDYAYPRVDVKVYRWEDYSTNVASATREFRSYHGEIFPKLKNSTIRKPYKEYYDNDDRKFVEERFEIDFKSFGYKWED
jgi:hypothetical protein